MYNQQSSSFNGSMSAFSNTPVTSQYRGYQKQYQPVGIVQSQYGQQAQSFGTAGQIQQSAYSAPSINAYHTASYHGNQPGHDNYWRADSTTPTQQQQQFGATQMSGTGTFAGTNAFHTANYRGDQPGHDEYLRSDSSSSYGIGAVQSQYQPQTQYQQQSQYQPQTQYQAQAHIQPLTQTHIQPLAQYQPQTQSQYQPQAQLQSGFASAQSYHTANYRGNQPGHDNYLRADSTQPSAGYRF